MTVVAAAPPAATPAAAPATAGVNLGWQHRVRLVDEVARVLRQRIYSGVYPPGELLRQVQLSEDLQVSRTPLREALRILQSEGLVQAQGARGVSVSRADQGRLLNAYAVREVLDGLAARQAAERNAHRAEALLAPMIALQHQALDPWSPADYMRLNVDFHTGIIALADNEFLTAQLAVVRMTATVFAPAALICPERARPTIDAHQAVATAIAADQGDVAEQLAREHIRAAVRCLRAYEPIQAAKAP